MNEVVKLERYDVVAIVTGMGPKLATEATSRLLDAVRVERVGIERAVRARAVLVQEIDVPVVDQRLRREQVVRLVARVVGTIEGVEPDRRCVGAEKDEPDSGGTPPHDRSLAHGCGVFYEYSIAGGF